MQAFRKGDRVEYIGELDRGINYGDTGVVCSDEYNYGNVRVRWDKKPANGHACGGHCKYGWGLNFHPRFLVHCGPDFEAANQSDMDALFSGG